MRQCLAIALKRAKSEPTPVLHVAHLPDIQGDFRQSIPPHGLSAALSLHCHRVGIILASQSAWLWDFYSLEKKKPPRATPLNKNKMIQEVLVSMRSALEVLRNSFSRLTNQLPAVTCAALLLAFAPNVFAWSGPYDIDNPRLVVTDKPLIAIKDFSCHRSGGFLFRIESTSKFNRVGKLSVKFYNKSGDPVGLISEEYSLGPKSQRLTSNYSPCNSAKSFALRHVPLT